MTAPKIPTPPPAVDPNLPPGVMDTQEVKRLILKAAAMLPRTDGIAIEAPKNPPYLLVILLMLLFGFVTVTAIVTLRPDLDFIAVSGVIFVIVTSMTTSIFGIIKNNQTLEEARQANLKAQLALEQTRETHSVVNSKLDQWKNDFMEAQIERSKVLEVAAKMDGRREGRDAADARTDLLASKPSV